MGIKVLLDLCLELRLTREFFVVVVVFKISMFSFLILKIHYFTLFEIL